MSVLFVFVILIVGVVFLISKNIKEKSNELPPGNETESVQEGVDEEESGKGFFLIALIFLIVIGAIAYVVKKSEGFQKILTDEEAIEESRKILREKYRFSFQNKEGSVVFYFSYYNAGDKRFPRAIVGWDLESRNDSAGSVEPIDYHLTTIDISRKNPKYDHQFLGSLTKKEALNYLHDIQFGRTGQSVDPIKQEKLVLSAAEEAAIDELKKERAKKLIKEEELRK